MPEQLDPEWEYWNPDPEIAEALEHSVRVAPLYALGLDYRESGRSAKGLFAYRAGDHNYGMRLGRGLKYDPIIDPEPAPFEIVRYGRPKGPIKRLACTYCGSGFDAVNGRDSMCLRCCPSSGKRRIAPRTCVNCLTTFRPRARRYSTFCSPKCGALYYGTLRPKTVEPPKERKVRIKWGPARTLPDLVCPTCKTVFRPLGSEQRVCSIRCRVPWRKIDLDTLRTLVSENKTTRQMADAFGVTTNAIRKAVKQLKEGQSK